MTTSREEACVAEELIGVVDAVTVLYVFGRPAGAEPVIDLRTPAVGATEPVVALSLDRAPGDRTHTRELGRLIADVVERSGSSTVTVSLGLGGADDQETSDATLLARRHARKRVRWIVGFDDGIDVENRNAGRVARRRMMLLLRGIRLEPVSIADAPIMSTARYWEVRSSHGS